MATANDYSCFRYWGNPPYHVAVLHGGPGAAGSVGSLACELGKFTGALEPFQSGHSIQEQLNELHQQIAQHASLPVILVGHSWGAWLAFIFASRFPSLVEKLILIAAPSFEESYVAEMNRIRKVRISPAKQALIDRLSSNPNSKESFQRMGELMSRIDSYNQLPIVDEIDFRPDIFSSIWNEAEKLRKENRFCNLALSIHCPVVAIHGDYDPHSWLGVKNPLEKWLNVFDFILLEKCGHYPWKEKQSKDVFYEELIDQIRS